MRRPPLRILHYVPRLDPRLGGPPAVALRLGRALAELGHRVTLCGGRAKNRETHEDPLFVQLADHPRLRIERFAYRPQLRTMASRRGPRPQLDAMGDFDLMHLHGVWEPHLLHAARHARARRRPYVITPHGALDPWSLQQKAAKKTLALRTTHHRLVPGADAIQVLTEFERRSVLRLWPRLHGATISNVANGVDLREIDAALASQGPERATCIPGLEDRPYILFLSRLHHKKGLELLGEAFDTLALRHERLALVVAGPDEDGSGARLRDQLAQRPASARLFLPGPVWGREKFALLRDAQCLVLPSRQEGLPLTILEAMACATPCVVSDQCHLPELAHAGGGIEVELSPPAIASAIEHYLDAAQRRTKAGQRGRALVESTFTWPRIARAIEDMYYHLLQPA